MPHLYTCRSNLENTILNQHKKNWAKIWFITRVIRNQNSDNSVRYESLIFQRFSLFDFSKSTQYLALLATGEDALNLLLTMYPQEKCLTIIWNFWLRGTFRQYGPFVAQPFLRFPYKSLRVSRAVKYYCSCTNGKKFQLIVLFNLLFFILIVELSYVIICTNHCDFYTSFVNIVIWHVQFIFRVCLFLDKLNFEITLFSHYYISYGTLNF